MDLLIEYISIAFDQTSWYIYSGLAVLFVNAFVAGYTGQEINKSDVISSAFWPVSLTVLLGAVSKALLNQWRG